MVTSSSERIGRFVLESELGRGSFSTVWRAHDPMLDRDVAIKAPRIKLDLVTTDGFLREAKRVAKLNHEGIVGVLEASIDCNAR